MIRNEELYDAAEKFSDDYKYSGDVDYMSIRVAFIEGAEWADNHPVNVWHNVSEEPKENSKIVIVDTKGEWWNIDYASDDFDGNGLYGWNFCIAHYNLKIWAYSNDLLPKVDKK